MSCIYGPHQFGTEDQGWVAHFLMRALDGEPITLYGDGMQVRDILYVDDLVDALLLARAQHRPARRPGVQHRRRTGATRSACSSCSTASRRSTATRPDVDFAGLAHRRPALLRLRHAHASSAATGWAPRDRRRRGHRAPVRLAARAARSRRAQPGGRATARAAARSTDAARAEVGDDAIAAQLAHAVRKAACAPA